jgi:hypothetical protein
MRIDEAGSIHHTDAVVQCETTAGQYKASKTKGNRNGDTRWHQGAPTTGCKDNVFTCIQIDTSVALMGLAWQREICV